MTTIKRGNGMNPTKTPEENLTEIVNKFIENKDRKEFIKSFEQWITSTHEKLKSQNKSDEEIGKIVGDICFRAGQMVTDTGANDMLKDVLASALLNFLVGYRYGGWKRS